MSNNISERFFYHSFPRRGASAAGEIDKGCKILAAIRDFGLLLTPQLIEWSQPSLGGTPPRNLPTFQKRVCFTELSPRELGGHAEKFGHFSLEFDIEVVRRLGAVPVFYVPQPSGTARDGSAIGTALLAIALDARAVIHRMSSLDKILHGPAPVMENFGFNPGFAGSPDGVGHFTLNRDEAKNFLAAIGHAVTPWQDFHAGIDALMNFFHPTDNQKTDKAMDYYREREWRIACAFRIHNTDGTHVDVMHVPEQEERRRFLEIDQEFFSREISTGIETAATLDQSLVLPGLNGTSIIDMVRRVIVPAEATTEASDLLSGLSNPPPIVPLEELNS